MKRICLIKRKLGKQLEKISRQLAEYQQCIANVLESILVVIDLLQRTNLHYKFCLLQPRGKLNLVLTNFNRIQKAICWGLVLKLYGRPLVLIVLLAS